jgi:3-isopropylmalate/(R)-2-methylmalate dehydratase small subunit
MTMKNFNGSALFLDRADINTDEIIPAKYLTEVTKEALQPHLFEDLKLDGLIPQNDIAGKNVIITRANFGCGSSREHAPWALEVNGIQMVLAESFARIFRQNMFNCGMMAVELPGQVIDHLFENYSAKTTTVTTDIEHRVFHIKTDNLSEEIPFSLPAFDLALVTAGGWLEYADSKY